MREALAVKVTQELPYIRRAETLELLFATAGKTLQLLHVSAVCGKRVGG
jgi:hypothetical protein